MPIVTGCGDSGGGKDKNAAPAKDKDNKDKDAKDKEHKDKDKN